MLELSVVIPAFNVKKCLQRSVESVLAQGCQAMEIILVDDGSTDGTALLCDQLAEQDERIRVLHCPHEGASAARIAGIRASRALRLAFVDSDDIVLANTYSQMLSIMQTYVDVDICICGYMVREPERSFNHIQQNEEGKKKPDDAIITMLENKAYNWALWGKIYTRKLFEYPGILDGWPYSYGEDYYVNWRLFHLAQNIYYLPIVGYQYNLIEMGLMRKRFSRDMVVYLAIHLDTIEQAIEQNEPVDVVKALVKQCVQEDMNIFWYMWQDNEHYVQEIDMYCKRLLFCISRSEIRISERNIKFLMFLAGGKHSYIHVYTKYRNELLEFSRRHNQIWLYGAGAIGLRMSKVLQSEGMPFKGFITTNGSRDDCSPQLKKYTLISIKELIDIMNECRDGSANIGILLTIGKKYVPDVEKTLSYYGIENDHVFNLGRYALEYR